jgi:ribosomal protein L7/L12
MKVITEGAVMERRLRTPQEEAAAVSAVKAMLHAGSGYEAALQYLRDRNYDQIDSIKVIRSAEGLTLKEAKELIHYSRTWEDRRVAAEAIHKAAFEAFDELRRENEQ